MRIGIDVGGTNTDAVVMDGDTVKASCKTVTTEDVGTGIAAALAAGHTPCEAAVFGSLVAGVTVQKLHQTGTATPGEIRAIAQA